MKTTTKKIKLSQVIGRQKWYYVNSEITDKNFPTTTTRTENWKLIRMTKSFSSQEALDEIKKQGCTPATAIELALWKEKHGDELKDWEWCLAFGQIWRGSGGGRGVPNARRLSGGDWSFCLGRFEGDWDSGYCLLCFCDQTLEPQTPSTDLSLESLKKELDEFKSKVEKVLKL